MLSHEDEVQMNGAFANIGLIASKVWAHDKEDKYRKLNQSLWLQNCKLSETYNGKIGKRTRVRDVIPGSRLAQYGNYEYSFERERLYNCEINEDRVTCEESENKKSWYKDYSNGARIEPWMFKQVDECFVRLMSLPTSAFLSLAKGQQFSDDESGKYMGFPCAIDVDHEDELQLRARICSKLVKDLWLPPHRRLHPDGQLQTRSPLTNYYEPRIFEALNVVQQQQQQEEKNAKMRRYCVEKRPEIIRKTCHQQNNALRNNERTFGVIDKRSSLLCPVVTMSSPIPSSRPSIVPAILCPEVAEFFPKGPIINVIGGGERRVSSPVQFFPSSTEPSYKEELFPYDQRHFSSTSSTFTHNASGLSIAAVSHPGTMNTWIGPNQWIQRIAPPIQIHVPSVPNNINPLPTMYTSSIPPFCTPPIALHHHHRPIVNERLILSSPVSGPVATPAAASVINETAPIPVYQRPAELYQETYTQRRASNKSGQGVDYKNLILLTKSAMKARRNQSRNPRRASSFILESRQPNLKSESDVLRWLNKGYPKRAREFGTVNSLVGELARFGGKCDLAKATSTTRLSMMDENEIAIDVADITEELLNDDDDDDDEDDTNIGVVTMAKKKRLYRDVLTNGGATSSDSLGGETILDKRYDELEQQAMEQYRTSEECLAMRYQELERQGLEQYRHGESSSESIRAVCSATLRSGKLVKDMSDGDESRTWKSYNINDPPSRDICSYDADKAGPTMERPIAILRSHAKYASVITNVRPRGFVRQHQQLLPVNLDTTTKLVTKSFTAFDRGPLSIDTKFPVERASGDKIEERGGTSLSLLRINIP